MHKRSESRALGNLIRSLAVIGLLAICLQNLHATPSSSQVEVVLDVQPFFEIHPRNPGEIVMQTITPDFFDGLTHGSMGSLGIEVRTNCLATLKCLDTVTLTRTGLPGDYTVDAGLMWMGVAGTYSSGQYSCLDLGPGVYLGTAAPSLVATLAKKTWTTDDAPGTYIGTVILELVPR